MLSIALAALVAVLAQPCSASGGAGFFVDWSTRACVESCLGPPPCAGRIAYPWENLFQSREQCCTQALSWKESECLAGGEGVSEGVGGPHEPIFFVDWNTNVCVQECFGDPPCSNRVRSFWEETFDTLETCCTTALPWTVDLCMRADSPTTKEPNIFDRPSQRPITAMPTGSTAVYFVDWSQSMCVRECAGDDPCSNREKHFWEEAFESLEQCCAVGLPWVDTDWCLRVTSPSTKKPNIFDGPSARPLAPPSLSPVTGHGPTSGATAKPTKSPSPAPTTASPTPAPPTGKPSTSPSDIPTTVEPTKSPSASPTTDEPSTSPSPAPTPAPTTTEPSESPSAGPITSTPTSGPTKPTTNESTMHYWYPEIHENRCVYGSGWPEWMGFIWNRGQYLFGTEEACCKDHECPSDSPSKSPPSLYWYPNLYTPHCVYGPGASWMSLPWNTPKFLFDSKAECCEKHGCDTETPTPAPSATPSAAPTRPAFWYPDVLGTGQCVFGPDYQHWMASSWNKAKYLFDDEETCCLRHGCDATEVQLFLARKRDEIDASNSAEPAALHLYGVCVLVSMLFWMH